MTKKIFIGLGLGALTGLILHQWLLNLFPAVQGFLVEGILSVGGEIFLRLLQMLVVPVVFVSLVCGVAGLGDIKKLGRVGGRAVGLFIGTTLVAVTIGLIMAWLIRPGDGFKLQTQSSFTPQQAPSLIETIVQMFPRNPIEAFAQADMLPIILFSLFLGAAISLSGKSGERILSLFSDLNEILLKLVDIVISFSPIGVFCLIAKVFSQQGFEVIVPLGKYFFTVLFALCIHFAFVYSAVLKLFGGLSPLSFIKKFSRVMFFAFSTSSSNATIPVSLETVEKKLGVPNSIASFVIPLGATINMDGTAIMQGVATVFVAQVYGVPLTFYQNIVVIFTATLASIGTAGVPGVGLIMLAMVFQQVGLPVEGIGIIMAVDRFLDMSRTAVNVTGDAVVACVVAKAERQLDEGQYTN